MGNSIKTPKIIFEIEKRLKDTKKYSLEVGWFDEFFAMIARVHEFGAIIKQKNKTIVIPPRPHRRKAVEKNKLIWLKSFKKALVINNFDVEKSLNAVMVKIIDDYRNIFTTAKFTPLATTTLLSRKSKGINGTQPLYATGELQRNITGKVIKND